MNEKDTLSAPQFQPNEPFIQVRDRALPQAAYHQGESLFDRKQIFVQKAAFKLNVKKPPAPVAKTRDISERRVGTTTKSIIGKLADKMIGAAAPTPKAVNPAAPKGAGVRGKPQKPAGKPVGVTATIQKSAQENAAASAAEALAA